jgi:hypothetical protein
MRIVCLAAAFSIKPTQNALIESFNGKFRDECLNQNWFVDLRHAREMIEAWRVDYNTVRPHSSLRYLTPEEFAASAATRPASPPHAGRLYGPSVGPFGRSGRPNSSITIDTTDFLPCSALVSETSTVLRSM